MEKFLNIILLTVLVIFNMPPDHTFAFNNLSSLNQPNGFRDIYWESSKDDHSYLFTTSGNLNGIEIYNRECENLTLGDANFSEIAYYYYNDKFYHVLITLRSDDDYKSLLEALKGAYGQPEKDAETYVWENKTVSIRLFSGGASISYLPILRKINKQNNG